MNFVQMMLLSQEETEHLTETCENSTKKNIHIYIYYSLTRNELEIYEFMSDDKFEWSSSEPRETCGNVDIRVDLIGNCPDVRCLDSNSRIVVFSNAKDNLKDVQFSFNYQLNFSFLQEKRCVFQRNSVFMLVKIWRCHVFQETLL